MTQTNLFEKYADYIPAGWYGFDSIPDEWVPEIDELLQEMIKVPDFEIHQIKEKFGGLRFYVKCDDKELMKKAAALEDKLFVETPWTKRVISTGISPRNLEIIMSARQSGKTKTFGDAVQSVINEAVENKEQKIDCPDCGGNGWQDGDGSNFMECSKCAGSGLINRK